MPVDALGRFLVKVPGSPLDATQVAALPGRTVPLYPDQGQRGAVDAMNPLEWLLHTPARITEEHPWDAAHEVVTNARHHFQTEAVTELYVEPDLVHRRYVRVSDVEPSTEGAQDPWPALSGLDSHYPPDPDEPFSAAWHLERGNFPAAWTHSKGENVRIAHLDTGYYPDHLSTPRHILPREGYNYFDGNSNVVDPGHHLNAGHGTATLALLAGSRVNLIYTSPRPKATAHTYSGDIGGAPEAHVVPVRIGGVLGSVVHLYSSSMAQGLHHAQGTTTPPCAPCDVVSLSHGGLPTKAWVDEVNRLYDRGIVLAAASGDSFYAKIIDIATHFTVYPSAWWRVITVTGETFSHGPYTTQDFLVMQGCWGPTPLMPKSLGAYTPNIPWMRLGSSTAWEMSGAGTSASTPQVAAACALWLSKNLGALPRDWRRVEATRYMLFSHLADPELNFEKIGRGALNAAGLFADLAVSAAIVADANRAQPTMLDRRDPDECSWPFFRLLFGLPPPGKGFDEMLDTEALQLGYRSTDPRLQEAMATYPNGIGIPARLARSLRQGFVRDPDMSRTLRTYLKPRV